MNLIIYETVSGTILIFGLINEIRSRKREKLEADSASKMWHEANENYIRWIEKYPFLGPSHPKAQELHRIRTGAWMIWVATHQPYEDNGQLQRMVEEIDTSVI